MDNSVLSSGDEKIRRKRGQISEVLTNGTVIIEAGPGWEIPWACHRCVQGDLFMHDYKGISTLVEML